MTAQDADPVRFVETPKYDVADEVEPLGTARDACCGTWPKPCTYHEGREDERDAIIRYLRRFPDNTRNEILFDVADWIEAGAHNDGSEDS